MGMISVSRQKIIKTRKIPFYNNSMGIEPNILSLTTFPSNILTQKFKNVSYDLET